jgi:hypothetical protein
MGHGEEAEAEISTAGSKTSRRRKQSLKPQARLERPSDNPQRQAIGGAE